MVGKMDNGFVKKKSIYQSLFVKCFSCNVEQSAFQNKSNNNN